MKVGIRSSVCDMSEWARETIVAVAKNIEPRYFVVCLSCSHDPHNLVRLDTWVFPGLSKAAELSVCPERFHAKQSGPFLPI